MSNFSGLSAAMSGMNAHRRRLDIISENVVNVNTEGYSRQRVDLSAVDRASIGLWTGARHNTGGVESTNIERTRDAILIGSARLQASQAENLTTEAEALARIETTLGGLEPGGLRDQMDELWNSFDDLASSPDDPAMRNAVLQKAETLAQGFSRTTTQIDQIRTEQEASVADTVANINSLAEQIASMDRSILGTLTTNAHPNSMLDERDRLVGELSSLVNLEVTELETGQVRLAVDGQLLVSNGRANELTLRRELDPTLAPLGYDRLSVANPSGRELRITSGRLAAGLRTAHETVPDQRRAIDALIVDLADQANTVHSAGVGLDGTTGNDLFDLGPDTGQISLSADVAGQPDKVAAAAGGAGLLDESNARDLAQLAEAADGPSSLLVSALSNLAAQVDSAQTRAAGARTASDVALSMATSQSAVSLDEELIELMNAQRAFEASARLVNTIDEMLETLMSMGRVGR